MNILAFASPSYIVGLTYYKLGSKTVIIDIPATIPNNTALVITLYKAYQQYNAPVNIVGSGRKKIKRIIGATYRNTLHFSSNLVNKQVSYSGYNKSAANKIAQNEFGKDAVIYSLIISPVNIIIFYGGKY